MQRLGKNIHSYAGETINISSVIEDCLASSQAHGWRVEELPGPSREKLLALTRKSVLGHSPGERRHIYISTGIHGDEPAGPLAVVHLLQADQWPKDVDYWLCPCLNPAGFVLNRRENRDGLDLNRQYLHPKAAETISHTDWLRNQPRFDLCLCLHEDWESHGFYVYELNPDDKPSLAPRMIQAVSEVCPIDHSDLIEGRPAKNGLIRPNLDPRSRPQWPESFFLLTHKTRLSYTLEAPSDFPLPVRVAALVNAVNSALKTFSGPP